jgi:hypothetical protein
MNDDTVLNALLSADDQILFPGTENDIQRALYTLHNASKQFGMEISPLKSEVLVIKRTGSNQK